MKNIFKFYIYSNLHVSLAIFSLIKVTAHLFDVVLTVEACFGFLGTFMFYHLTRYFNRHNYGKTHKMFCWSQQHQTILKWMFLIATISTLILVFYFSINQLLSLIPIGLLTLLYGVKIIRYRDKTMSLRFVPGFKIFLIALVWSGVVVVFPLIDKSVELWKVVCFSIEIILFVIALTLPFDIRDLAFDAKNLKTLPQILGLKGVKRIGVLILLIGGFLHFITFGLTGLYLYLLISLILTISLYQTQLKQSEYYTSFWIESIPILWITLIELFNLI